MMLKCLLFVMIMTLLSGLSGCVCTQCQSLLPPQLGGVVLPVPEALFTSKWQLTNVHSDNPLLNELTKHRTMLHVVKTDKGLKLNASMGCNTLNLPILIKNQHLMLDKTRHAMSTETYCVDRHDVEVAYFNFLNDIKRYELTNGGLTLSDNEYTLVFNAE